MTRGQAKHMSLIEVFVGTFLGFFVSVFLTFYILPIWDLHPSERQSFEIAFIFTVVSLIRGYLVRRWFNGS